MGTSPETQVAVVGGGIVGLATALALVESHGVVPVVLEAESRLASHQSGHNSGVIHSGIYYRPGSRKALDCAAGRDAMYAFCERHGVRAERSGKVLVAADEAGVERLRALGERARQNGLDGVRELDAHELAEREPHARGRAALWVPQTGVVDFVEVAGAMAERLRDAGVEVRTASRVTRVEREPDGFRLHTTGGEVRARSVINCGGLQSDRVARACGVDPGLRIVPFRGEYCRLVDARAGLVRGLIYPVPDPRLPFLGVHLTRTVRGVVEAGPNAVLAFSRNGYERGSFSARDALATLSYPGFWRMAARYWKTGFREVRRSMDESAFARALQQLVPEITASDLVRHTAGVRAQAVSRDGRLIDDFHIVEAPGMLHVLNAPSPAATASLAIGCSLAKTWSQGQA